MHIVGPFGRLLIKELAETFRVSESDICYMYLCFSEKVVVPADKPYITLSGTNANSTIITWNEAWFNQQSATLSILASDFVGRYLTVQVQK